MRPGHFSTTLSLDAWPLTMFACRLHAQLSKDTVEDIIHYADQSHFCRDEYVFKNSLSDLAWKILSQRAHMLMWFLWENWTKERYIFFFALTVRKERAPASLLGNRPSPSQMISIYYVMSQHHFAFSRPHSS